MTVFQNLEQAAEDFKVCFLAVSAAQREGREIIKGIEDRARAEKSQRAERVTELKKQLADNSRSNTVLRLSAAELADLEAQKFEPSKLELEAFEDCCLDLAQAVKDVDELRKKLVPLFKAATTELDELRSSTLGNQRLDPVLLERAANDLRAQLSHALSRIAQ